MLPILAPLLLAAQTGFLPPVLKGVKGDVPARTITGPIAFPQANEKWTRVRSPHFVLISSAGESRTRDIANELETLAAALSSLTPQFRVATDAPTRVFLFARPKESRGYFDMLLDRRDAHVSGVFVSQKAGGTMLLNASAREGWREAACAYAASAGVPVIEPDIALNTTIRRIVNEATR